MSTRVQNLPVSAKRAVVRVRPFEREPAGAEKRQPDLRVVPRVRRRRAGLAAVLICLVVFGVMLGLVAFQAKIAADQSRLDRIEKDTAAAQAQYERLRLDVVQLESPQNVIASAQSRGMVVPTSVAYVAPSAADVVAVDSASGRASADPAHPPTSGDDWSRIKPIVGGGG